MRWTTEYRWPADAAYASRAYFELPTSPESENAPYPVTKGTITRHPYPVLHAPCCFILRRARRGGHLTEERITDQFPTLHLLLRSFQAWLVKDEDTLEACNSQGTPRSLSCCALTSCQIAKRLLTLSS